MLGESRLAKLFWLSWYPVPVLAFLAEIVEPDSLAAQDVGIFVLLFCQPFERGKSMAYLLANKDFLLNHLLKLQPGPFCEVRKG